MFKGSFRGNIPGMEMLAPSSAPGAAGWVLGSVVFFQRHLPGCPESHRSSTSLTPVLRATEKEEEDGAGRHAVALLQRAAAGYTQVSRMTADRLAQEVFLRRKEHTE